ncbi:flagellar hook-length control protein FliK [Mycoplana ramosa]|uniref:Flagellar hook-length control protein FliK n=1 Tax=Mycoplana ramosa TaxID=40837 RepID=A0ABW3YWV9_MYCRA
MTTIDTSALNQVAPKQGPGKDKAQTDGDGKGHGKFADAFANLANTVAGSGAANLEAVANRASGVEAAAADGGRSPKSIGQKLPSSHRSGGFPALTDASRLLDDAAGADAADGQAHPTEGLGIGARRIGAQSRADGVDDAEPAEPTTPESSGEDAELGSLLSMLAGAASTEVDPSHGAQSSPSLGAAVAVLTQRNHGGKDANGGRSDDFAGRNSGMVISSSADAGPAADGLADASGLPDGHSDADQVFRLVRADGRGKAVEIAISGNGEASAMKDQGGAKVEAVTILDSRRYLGLAQTGNSAAVTAAIAQDRSWAAALADTADKAPDPTGKVVNTLKIQLHPIDLGTVTATLRLQGDALVVDLKVETGKAYRNLSEDQDAIVKALRGHGFSVDQISVQLTSSSDRSGGAGQGDAQAQFSGQQQAREGGGGRQGEGEARFASSMDPNEGSAHEYGQADVVAADQLRSVGGVYL